MRKQTSSDREGVQTWNKLLQLFNVFFSSGSTSFYAISYDLYFSTESENEEEDSKKLNPLVSVNL